MFAQLIESAHPDSRSRMPLSFTLALTIHILAIGLLLILPLLFPRTLANTIEIVAAIMPPLPPLVSAPISEPY